MAIKARGSSQEAVAEAISKLRGTAITRGAVGNWARGLQMTMDNLKWLSSALSVPLQWLMTGGPPLPDFMEEPEDTDISDFFAPDPEPDQLSTIGSETGRQGIPQYGIPEIDAKAGLGIGGVIQVGEATAVNGRNFAADIVRDYWVVPGWMLARMGVRSEHVVAFAMEGDSMEPTLFGGEVGFVDMRHRIPSPPGIYAIIDQLNTVIFKRLEVVSRPSASEVVILVKSDNPRHTAYERNSDEMPIIGRYIGKFTTG